MQVRHKQALNAAILVAGLAFCVAALMRLQWQYPLHVSLTAGGVLLVVACALLALSATTFAWQCYMKAFLNVRLPLRDALYQICVMQIGKYVPVMIGGFVARVSANVGNLSTERIVVATTVEQIGAMGVALLVGICCYVLALIPAAAALGLACTILVAWFAPAVLAVALRIFARLRGGMGSAVWAVDRPSPRSLREALGLQVLQMIAMVGFIGGIVSMIAPHLGVSSVAIVTGAYLISVVIGIAIFFLPGGIGAREAVLIWLTAGQIDSREALQLALALRIGMSALDLLAGATCLALRLPLHGGRRH